ncbi:MAG: DUF6132 family protein [Verrucomicrobiota bacterium]
MSMYAYSCFHDQENTWGKRPPDSPDSRRGMSRFFPVLIGGAIGAAMGYFGQCTSGACPLTSTWWRGALYGATLGGLFAFSSSR